MPERHVIGVDDDELVAIHHRAPSTEWVVFSHGFVSDKGGSYEGRCERVVEAGYNGVRFDHRGCGESDLSFGEQTLTTRIDDLHAVLDYFDPSTAVLFGSSFGGLVAFHAALDDGRVRAVAARAPVTDTAALDQYRSAAATGLGPDFVADLEVYEFATVTDRLRVPCVIFHGRADETVPVTGSIDAARDLECDVSLQLSAGEGHSFSREAETRLREALVDWLARL